MGFDNNNNKTNGLKKVFDINNNNGPNDYVILDLTKTSAVRLSEQTQHNTNLKDITIIVKRNKQENFVFTDLVDTVKKLYNKFKQSVIYHFKSKIHERYIYIGLKRDIDFSDIGIIPSGSEPIVLSNIKNLHKKIKSIEHQQNTIRNDIENQKDQLAVQRVDQLLQDIEEHQKQLIDKKAELDLVNQQNSNITSHVQHLEMKLSLLEKEKNTLLLKIDEIEKYELKNERELQINQGIDDNEDEDDGESNNEVNNISSNIVNNAFSNVEKESVNNLASVREAEPAEVNDDNNNSNNRNNNNNNNTNDDDDEEDENIDDLLDDVDDDDDNDNDVENIDDLLDDEIDEEDLSDSNTGKKKRVSKLRKKNMKRSKNKNKKRHVKNKSRKRQRKHKKSMK
jgi:hypothetical protein